MQCNLIYIISLLHFTKLLLTPVFSLYKNHGEDRTFFFGAAAAASMILYLEAKCELKEARKEVKEARKRELLLHEQRKQEEEMQRRGLCIWCGRRNYKETSV